MRCEVFFMGKNDSREIVKAFTVPSPRELRERIREFEDANGVEALFFTRPAEKEATYAG